MSFSPLRSIGRVFVFIWNAIDALRRAMFNVLLLLLILFVVIAMTTGGSKHLDDKTALVLDFKGRLVEQRAANVRDLMSAGSGREAHKDTQLRDLLTVLEAAAKDEKITSVVLVTDGLENAGMPILHEVGAALETFKASGKPVIAWGGHFDQKQYLLAAHANEIYLDPMGMVAIQGFGGYRNYYRDALDKLGITVNLMRVGTYKSFAEPFIANEPSPAATEAETYLYQGMWTAYTQEIERLRKFPAGSVQKSIDELPQAMATAEGDTARLAFSAKLVDGLKTREEFRQYMIAKGAKDEKDKTFRQVALNEYLSRQMPKLLGDAVGVVIAQGEISDGEAPAGFVGGESTARLIRKARNDKDIKAVVLRVDSPGGSAYGSELIRRELELTRTAGKPVIVSMGNVAASGGYWISMSSDEVIADPTTITGSIGVFALLPTLEKGMDKLGVHTGGVTTTWLAGGFDPRRAMDPRFGSVVQSAIGHIYSDFITKAAQARKTTPQKIDEVGQGRVWTGEQAKERGLVDRVGGYGDALKSAATRAKLGEDYRVVYIEKEPSRFERLAEMFDAKLAEVFGPATRLNLMANGLPTGAAREAASDLAWLSDLTSGKQNYAAMTHCLCREP